MSILICCYLMPFLTSLIGVKIVKNSDNLSLDATQSIRGIGMILIIFAHAIENTINDTTYFFYVSAILGVAGCFLVSGYGLFISFSKKDNYLKGFLFQKFSRLIIPYLLFFVISIIVNIISGNFSGIKNILFELVTLQLDGLLLWYLKIQLLLYVFFYLSFRFIKKVNIAIFCTFLVTLVYCLIAWKCGLKSYWYNTCMFFPIGILLAKNKNVILPKLKKWYVFIPCGIAALSIYLIIYLFGKMNIEIIIDTAYMLFFNMFLLGIFMNIRNSHFLNIIGKYSMEIYIAHLLLLNWHIFGIYNPENGLSYIILLVATIALSIPIHIISNKLNNKITAITVRKKE